VQAALVRWPARGPEVWRPNCRTNSPARARSRRS